MKVLKEDGIAIKLAKLATGSEEIAKKAIYKGAGILANKIGSNLDKVLSGDSTGEMQASLGITPIKKDRNGVWNAKVGFDGYDSRGVPNAIKARVLESGSSQQKKRPFVRPAINSTKNEIISAMNKVVDDEINKITKG